MLDTTNKRASLSLYIKVGFMAMAILINVPSRKQITKVYE